MYILAALFGYLIGSISITRIITKMADPNFNLENVDFVDPKTQKRHRLRTISATTAGKELGNKVGGKIAMLDAVKGFLPVFITYLLFPDNYYHLVAGVAVVTGHCWSIYHRFTGGGGLTPTYGVFMVINWWVTLLLSTAGMALGFIFLRNIFVAFYGGPIMLLIWLIIFKGDWPHILFGIAMNLVLFFKILPDAIQIIKNDEMKDVDMNAVMDQQAMGRYFNKIRKSLGLDR